MPKKFILSKKPKCAKFETFLGFLKGFRVGQSGITSARLLRLDCTGGLWLNFEFKPKFNKIYHPSLRKIITPKINIYPSEIFGRF